MLNDLGDKYEGQDDSEYHFSDDEVSYEVEPEPEPPKASGGGLKESILTRLSRSKRMIISGVVFIVLVFIVYKMVTPTTIVPATNISSAPVASTQPVSASAPAAAQTQAPTAPAVATVAQPPTSAVSQPAVQAQPMQEAQPPAVAAAQPSAAQPLPATQQMMQQPQAAAQEVVQTVANMPPVIPVQSPPPAYNVNQPGTMATTLTPTANAASASLSAISDKVYSQYQADNAQKLNEYAIQNKMLQEQLNTLNTRVANMETQLNQLVQALTHQGQSGSELQPQHAPPAAHGTDTKLVYNVQAIIPGRAWLRSESGETLTVAEGDIIKDLGRVSKIDPYDGIVEVNTGTKMLSLSYGNGG